MKSQRRNNQSKRKSQKKSQQNNNNNRQQKQKKSQQNNRNQEQNKRSQRRSRNNSRSSNSKKSSQKQRKYRNQQRVQVQRKRKYNRSKNQRRSRSKNSQRGGYGSLDYSVIPCKEVGGVSVPDFDSAADASPKICSDNLDMVRDAEVSVADGVSTLSGLSQFVQGGTTQVIKSSEDASGRGLSAEETSRLMNNIADETKYRELNSLDGEEGRQTRSSGEATEYTTLGEAESDRWGRLSDRGFTGDGAFFEERVEYSAPQ